MWPRHRARDAQGQEAVNTRVTCAYHCGACHSHLASLDAFDAHRAGDHSGERHCLGPDDVEKLGVKSDEGVCRMYAEPVEGVTVYWVPASAGRAREAFAGLGVKREAPREAGGWLGPPLHARGFHGAGPGASLGQALPAALGDCYRLSSL
jgi:hypothetical protein